MSRRAELRKKRRRQRQRQNRTLILIVVGAALLVTGLLILPDFRPVGEIAVPGPSTHPMAEGTALGDPNAPVVLEEFADFQCPACRRFFLTTGERIVQEYVTVGKVYYIFRHFPFLGPDSQRAASASMCAAEQGRFWEYHDYLFANQGAENTGGFSDLRLAAFAERVGLDQEVFDRCYRSDRHQSEIDRDYERGIEVGVTGTPTILINGEVVEGAGPGTVPTYDILAQAIEGALAGAP